MKYQPQSKQHVKPNAPQNFQSEDIIPSAPTEQMYQQGSSYHTVPQFSSPVVADGTVESFLIPPKNKDILQYNENPTVAIFAGILIGIAPTIVMIILFFAIREYFILWMLCFPTIGLISILLGQIQKLTLDRRTRKMYGSYTLLGCFLCSTKYEIDFDNIADIQCTISYWRGSKNARHGKREM